MNIRKVVGNRKRLVLLAGAVLLFGMIGIAGAIPEKREPEEIVRRKPRVETVPVAMKSVRETFAVPGTVAPWGHSELSVERAGIVQWIGVEDGDAVKRGAPVLKVSSDVAGSDVERQKATLELRKKDFERTRSLFDAGAVSRKRLDDAENAFLVARAEYESASANLAHAILRSPVDGVIDEVHVRLGEYAAPGETLADIVQIDRVKVDVEVSERDVASLSVGDDVVIEETLPGDEPGRYHGTVGHVSYRADEASRTYRVSVHVDADGDELRPGRIVRVRFIRKSWDHVAAVPLFAVSESDGSAHVFVNEGGFARPRPVRLGPIIGAKVVVVSGLVEGDELIVTGHQFLTGNEEILAERN